MDKLLKGRQLKAMLKEVFGPIKREKWATYQWDKRLIYFNDRYRGIQAWEHEGRLCVHFRYKLNGKFWDIASYNPMVDLNLEDVEYDLHVLKVLDKLDKMNIKL
jgi:hypothetical protein